MGVYVYYTYYIFIDRQLSELMYDLFFSFGTFTVDPTSRGIPQSSPVRDVRTSWPTEEAKRCEACSYIVMASNLPMTAMAFSYIVASC